MLEAAFKELEGYDSVMGPSRKRRGPETSFNEEAAGVEAASSRSRLPDGRAGK